MCPDAHAEEAKRAFVAMQLCFFLLMVLLVFFAMALVAVFEPRNCHGSSPKEAKIEVGNLSSMVEQYMLKGSPPRLPDRLAQLEEGSNPVTRKVPKDPWGAYYVYRKTGNREFEVFSLGPDGLEGTEDDVRQEE